jgi:hypothetical protein
MAKERPARAAEAGQLGHSERRAWIRYPTERDAFCHRGIGTDRALWWQAQIRDLAAGGIGLVLNRPCPPGTLVSVELPATHAGILDPKAKTLV